MPQRAKTTSKNDSIRWQRLARLMDRINVPIFLFAANRPGNPMLYQNGSAEHLLGYGEAALGKVGFADLFHNSEADRAKAMLSVLESGKGENQLEEPEVRVLARSRKTTLVKVTANSMALGSQHVLMLSLVDLTEQKRIQAERERNLQEFTRISKLADIGQLVAGVAHELNNPLMIVQGYAENIEITLEDDEVNRDQIRMQLEAIMRASDRMAKIISHMMRMVRNDDFHMRTVDLRDVVEDALQFGRLRLDGNFVRTRVLIDDSLPVCCDPNQIEQILMNIMSNAAHALSQLEGERELTISGGASESGVTLSLANNGPPIPEEIRDRIMTPFFTTKPVGEGTGLGLATSFGIMKNHGGDLTFSSSTHETKFVLHFPLAQQDDDHIRSRQAKGRMVLIADDNAELRAHLATKLERYGYKVMQAANGDELMMRMRRYPEISCVIADYTMPNWHPSKQLAEIRAQLPEALVYVLADDLAPCEFALKQNDLHGFIEKPVDQETFAKLIEQMELHSQNRRVG